MTEIEILSTQCRIALNFIDKYIVDSNILTKPENSHEQNLAIDAVDRLNSLILELNNENSPICWRSK